MRRVTPSILALLAAAPAFAEDIYVQAPVAAATVYPSGAALVHRASFDLAAGTHQVYLPFAGAFDLDALPRIRTSDGVSIGTLGFQRDVSVARDAILTPNQSAALADVEAARDAVMASKDALRAAEAEASALQARIDYLMAVAPGEAASAEDILAMADTITTEMTASRKALVAAEAGLRPLTREVEERAAALAAAERALARLSPPEEVSDMLVVEVSVAEAGPVTLELDELTYDGGWQMDYDINLDREAGALSVTRKLVVMQQTGVTWDGVDLTLSTMRPGEDVSPADVSPDRARLYKEVQYEARTMAAAPAPMMEDAMVEPEIMLDGAMKTATMQVDGLALSYVYPAPVTIASGEGVELALDTLDLEATPSIAASPRWDETAFQVARFTNTTGEPLLPGPANFLRDGHLVGRDRIEMIAAGAETTLAFGAIEGIRLGMAFEANAEGDTGLISKSNTREQRISFSVENLTGEAQEVTARYPLTFSEQEDLKVKVTATPTPSDTDIDKLRGVSEWDITLAPGEKKEVTIDVEMSWPEGMELSWNP